MFFAYYIRKKLHPSILKFDLNIISLMKKTKQINFYHQKFCVENNYLGICVFAHFEPKLVQKENLTKMFLNLLEKIQSKA